MTATCKSRNKLRRVVGRLLRHAQNLLIFSFVCWHVTFLLMRNAIDLDSEKAQKWLAEQGIWNDIEALNEAQLMYEKRTGVDQGWKMFGSPVARRSPFPAVRIEFDDGGSAVQLSDNEQENPAKYFRIGKWRLRKYEHYLATKWEERFAHPSSKFGLLWKDYVHWRLAVWRERHPDDQRRPVRLVLIARRFAFPKPDADPSHFDPPDVKTVATFNVEAKSLP